MVSLISVTFLISCFLSSNLPYLIVCLYCCISSLPSPSFPAFLLSSISLYFDSAFLLIFVIILQVQLCITQHMLCWSIQSTLTNINLSIRKSWRKRTNDQELWTCGWGKRRSCATRKYLWNHNCMRQNKTHDNPECIDNECSSDT